MGYVKFVKEAQLWPFFLNFGVRPEKDENLGWSSVLRQELSSNQNLCHRKEAWQSEMTEYRFCIRYMQSWFNLCVFLWDEASVFKFAWFLWDTDLSQWTILQNSQIETGFKIDCTICLTLNAWKHWITSLKVVYALLYFVNWLTCMDCSSNDS